MNQKYIQQFRECFRILEREIFFQNTASCCKGVSLSQCHALLEIENNDKISSQNLLKTCSLIKAR